MGVGEAQIVLPGELVEQIDALVGPGDRSAFLIEIVQTELRRRRLLSTLRSGEPIWSDQDHPELQDDSSAWVRGLRQASDLHGDRSEEAMTDL